MKRKGYRTFSKSDARVRSQNRRTSPTHVLFYCRERVLNMSVKKSRSEVQARSNADMDG